MYESIGKEDVNKCFGTVLRELREAMGLTQEELAEDCKIETAYISRLERGISNPSLLIMLKIAESLKIEPGDIINKVHYICLKHKK